MPKNEEEPLPAPVALETERLLLRPWRVAEAAVQRRLWEERDPRVPAHRRLDLDGHPTIDDLAERIRLNTPAAERLLAAERKDTHEVIGYCGLIDGWRPGGEEPELAFELLRRVWNQGFATEAALAVLDRARACGRRRVWATVWDWNIASLRVLAKVGFSEWSRMEPTSAHGTTLIMFKQL